jgi:hypothetical protein
MRTFQVSGRESFFNRRYIQPPVLLNKPGKKEVAMDANAIMTMVQTLGFPIVCCGVLFWRMMKESDNHKAEMEKVTDALNNNTQALIRLEESLKGEKEK